MKRALPCPPALWAGHEAPPPRARRQADVLPLAEANSPAAFAHWRRGLLISFVLHVAILAFCLPHGDVSSEDGGPVHQLALVSISGKGSHAASSASQAKAPPEPAPAMQPSPARHRRQSPSKQNRVRRQGAKPSAALPETGATSASGASAQTAGRVPSQGDIGGGAGGGVDHEGVFAPGQLDHPPTPLRRVRPEYPPEARKKRTEGRVLVRMIVDSKGLPTQCAIHAAAPPGYFEAAALEAARKMRFSPGRKDGRAVRTTVLLPFDFKLR